jgi:ribulose-5-phosphate 4-epimerase/fuculose-1-phosphate aldolase
MTSTNILEEDLKIASKILEWEIGDIWGHVGVRLPDNKGITAKLFRLPDEGEEEDWIIRFDYSLKKISGVGRIPNESTIYTEIFKARPDVNAIAHCHAPMCITLSMANKQIGTMHMQSKQYAGGIPMFPRPIFIIDEAEGGDLARTLGQSIAVVMRGHGIVTVGATIKEACINALYLERTAKMQAIANALGFQGVDQAFLREVDGSWRKLQALLGKKEPSDRYAAEWRYYKRKVLKGEYWSRGWI